MIGGISLKPKIKRVVSLSREASRKSDCYIGMSAVLVKKNQVVAVGYNKKWNGASLHAEEDVLKRAKPQDIEGATLYITRYGNKDRTGISRLAAPCARCSKRLRYALDYQGLKAVYYTVVPENPAENIVSLEKWKPDQEGYVCKVKLNP